MHLQLAIAPVGDAMKFQSPSRGGRYCISKGLAAMLLILSFSPLLVGDGIASPRGNRGRVGPIVSVPFSWGTVLHLAWELVRSRLYFASFSPLLVGDGIASFAGLGDDGGIAEVSVPFSWGTVLHRCFPRAPGAEGTVSVPFSWGTVLHPTNPNVSPPIIHKFQSPSRGGRYCIHSPPWRRR